MTKAQIIAKLKSDFPTLKKTLDGVESDMTTQEYETQIQTWAEIELIRIADEEAATVKASEKQALLDRLGLTADEAKLLLS